MTHRESSADARLFARTARDYYDALLGENFTEPEALELIGRTLAASVTGRGDQK